MADYAAPIEFNPRCLPTGMAMVEDLASYNGTVAEAGFSGGRAIYSRTVNGYTYQLVNANRGEHDEMMYLWSLSVGGSRAMMFRPPGTRKPERVRFRNFTSTATSAGSYTLEVELEGML